MIAPGAEIVELEPDGFAHLTALLARRDRTPPHHIQVLHAGGDVLRVVDTRTGPVDAHREHFSDPRSRAAELLAATGADRVTLIDRSGIGTLAADVNGFADPDTTQPELLWRANERFWSHPAVVTAPEPPRSPWPGIAGRLRELGDEYTAVLGVWRGDDLFLSCVAEMRDGIAVRITSSGARPPRSRAEELVSEGAHGPLPPVRLALLCDVEVLDDVLGAPDPAEELAKAIDDGRTIYHRGIGEVVCAPNT